MTSSHRYIRIFMLSLAAVATCACLAATAVAAEATNVPDHVTAGTVIPNTAVVSYVVSGVTFSQSADYSFVVDQLLDVTATWQDANSVVAPAGASDLSLLFKVTNTGNGGDSYALALTVSPDPSHGFTATGCELYLDSDHNGTWSNQDAPYPDPAPTVAAGDSLDILAVCDIPPDADDQSLSNVKLAVVSNTLSGEPGTSEPDPDQSGVILVVGLTGNTAAATGTFIAINVTYTLTSTQQVIDEFGGEVAAPGSHIIYTITTTATGSATGRDLVLTTPIPEYTTYVPGSLELDGTHVTDSESDDDGGYFDPEANTTVVLLGDVNGDSAAKNVTFQVTIN